MQLQGDVLEIDLEQRLAAHFPVDLLAAVSTGVRGADVQHTVRTAGAQSCGVADRPVPMSGPVSPSP